MPSAITVQTGARLHFGLLAVQAPNGRNFGGVGLMVQSPGCELTVRVGRESCDWGLRESVSRLMAWLKEYRSRCPSEHQPPLCDIAVVRAIPPHVGLGSGTQTALALAAALARLGGEQQVSAAELARRIGRGARSALGLHGFELGGLLVEGGKRSPQDISPLVARMNFPDEWRVLLITPNDRRGLSGEAERTAFSRLAPMAASLTDELCRITLMELLPSVASSDFDSTAAALRKFGRLNGSHFAPVQGGIFADAEMATLAQWLTDEGCVGLGQSSWGPTLWVLCRDEPEAVKLRERIAAQPSARACTIHLTAAQNAGASIGVQHE